MKYRVKDLEKFENTVFGADDLLMFFPALETTGVTLVKQGKFYYVADSNNEPVSDSTFFSEEEVTSCLEPV